MKAHYHYSPVDETLLKGRTKVGMSFRNMLTKLSLLLRRRQLYKLYSKNSASSDAGPHLIYLTSEKRTRGVGLTTLMVKDCIKNNHMLYIGDNSPLMPFYVKMFQEELLSCDDELANYPSRIREYFLLTSSQLSKCSPSDCRNMTVVVDNVCTLNDLHPLFNRHMYIVNGFVTCPGFNITTA